VLIPPEHVISKDSPDFIEYVKISSEKSQKSNPEDKGFGVFLGVMVSAATIQGLPSVYLLPLVFNKNNYFE
jgi:hypothetical protein